MVYSARKIHLFFSKHELNHLEQIGIIQKVSEPTDRVYSVVVVRKPCGKICLCLDPKQLNKLIKSERNLI